jgi:hypothetical protein
VFAPVYNSSDGTETEVLRDSKIDQISSVFSGKTQNNLQAIFKVFVVCFVCVIVALLFVAIVAIEMDVDMCRRMRRIPEVEYFQFEVYEPFKNFMREKFHKLEPKFN